MQDRTVSTHFDGFSTKVKPLENAGLARGSPLSPILFTLLNSHLVDQEVDIQGGASTYIDDYFRWRVGRSAEENLQKIQQEDIPRITEWAQLTGSSFTPEKTELIYLTRRKKERRKGSITMDGQVIEASRTAKLLGVIFDDELRWKDHVQQTVKAATTTALGMGGLRHLRPAQMKQIYKGLCRTQARLCVDSVAQSQQGQRTSQGPQHRPKSKLSCGSHRHSGPLPPRCWR